jgi:hypothetical protein
MRRQHGPDLLLEVIDPRVLRGGSDREHRDRGS